MRPLAAAAALLVLGLGLTSCGSDSKATTTAASSTTSTSTDTSNAYGGGTSTPTSAAGASAVSIKGFAFNPPELKVAKGATVRVTNDDGVTHTWTADDKSFDSGQLASGKSTTHTFDTAGSYSYHCEIHKNMKGTIVVS
jgi:plastocyanin